MEHLDNPRIKGIICLRYCIDWCAALCLIARLDRRVADILSRRRGDNIFILTNIFFSAMSSTQKPFIICIMFLNFLAKKCSNYTLVQLDTLHHWDNCSLSISSISLEYDISEQTVSLRRPTVLNFWREFSVEERAGSFHTSSSAGRERWS